ATRFNEYAAGQLDVSGIPTGRCRALQADPKLKADVAIWPTLGTSALRFNVERAPFTDARVRRAIAHAIDPAIIVNRVLEGCVAPAQGIVPPVLAGWTATAKRLPLDRERARSLLAEAGFPGGRGLGPLAYHFNTGDLNQRIAEALQAQLKEVGVELERRRLGLAVPLREPCAHQAAREGAGAQPPVHRAGVPRAAAQGLAGALGKESRGRRWDCCARSFRASSRSCPSSSASPSSSSRST